MTMLTTASLVSIDKALILLVSPEKRDTLRTTSSATVLEALDNIALIVPSICDMLYNTCRKSHQYVSASNIYDVKNFR